MNGDVVARGAARTGSVFVAVTEYIRRFEVRGVSKGCRFLLGEKQIFGGQLFLFLKVVVHLGRLFLIDIYCFYHV